VIIMEQYTIQTNEEDIRTVIPKDEFDLTLFKTLVRSVQELEKIVSEQGTEIDKLRKSNSRLRSDINRVVNFVRSNHG